MADDDEQHLGESDSHGDALLDKVTEKLHARQDSSSSSDDDEKPPAPPEVEPVTAEGHAHSIFSPASSTSSSSLPSPHPNVRSKIYRLFGREQPVHKVLGGGKTADIFLWRNKRISGTVLGVATGIWFLFELLEYHLLTLICHLMILALSILFLWSHASSFINKSPPQIPDVQVPEKAILELASMLRYEINRSLIVVRQVAAGKDRKKFFTAIGILWFVGAVSSWFSFLTLCYLFVLMLHTLPVFYEKYEDQVDAYGEKAAIQIHKYYAEFNGKVLSKVPKGRLGDKKAV